MKISLKNSLIILSAALAVLFTGCASTPKGLTPSQAVGANHSPAALYMITFSDNAKDIFSAISKELKCKYFVKVNVKAGVRTTKTAVKPATKPTAPARVFPVLRSPPPAKYEMYMGSMGSRQGEMNVMMPSRKDITYCIRSHIPFRKHRTAANQPGPYTPS